MVGFAEGYKVDTNPNFSGPVKGDVLLARTVLADQFAEHGLVTEAIEQHLVLNWERENKMALMTTWEERAWRQQPDENDVCPRCGIERTVIDEIYNPSTLKTVAVPRKVPHWKQKGAPHAESESYPYFERAARYAKERELVGSKTIDMDPEVAKERIDLLLRSPNPAEHAREINELRTQVLGLDPIEFQDGIIETPIVTQGMPASNGVLPVVGEESGAGVPAAETAAPTVSPEDAKLANFLTMDWREQKAVVEKETDLNFLLAVRKASPKHVIPTVRSAAKKRSETLSGAKE